MNNGLVAGIAILATAAYLYSRRKGSSPVPQDNVLKKVESPILSISEPTPQEDPRISEINNEITEIDVLLSRNENDLGINRYSNFPRFDAARQELVKQQSVARTELVILQTELATLLNTNDSL